MMMLSRMSFGCVVLLALVAGACDTVPLTAPTGSSVTISTASSVVPTGGTTEVTAFVLEGSGTAAQNGTSVRFTTNLGRMEPIEAQTKNGYATSTFVAGDVSGVADVTASSGGIGAGTSGGTGTDGNATATTSGSNSVKITVGAAASETVVLNASRSTVPQGGGTVTLIASVLDINGNRLRNAPINFSTTAGTLSATVATTDVNGEARVELTTNREATVTARAGAKSATLNITVDTPTTILVGASPSSVPIGGGTVTVTALVLGAGGNRLSNVPINFSTTAGNLSPTFSTTDENGEARVELTTITTATVTARAGTVSGSTTVPVSGATAAPPATVLLSANPSSVPSSGGTVTLTATVLDANSNRVGNVAVSFSTTAGTLSTTTALTDANGEARVTLTTSSPASVTARAGTVSGTASVTVM
jgi:adhesin/invasin